VRHCGILSGTFHRALADAEMTGHLWIAMTDLLKSRHGLLTAPFPLMQELSRMGRGKVSRHLQEVARQQRATVLPTGSPLWTN
jgi:DNA polymerase-3 subunit epsilon